MLFNATTFVLLHFIGRFYHRFNFFKKLTNGYNLSPCRICMSLPVRVLGFAVCRNRWHSIYLLSHGNVVFFSSRACNRQCFVFIPSLRQTLHRGCIFKIMFCKAMSRIINVLNVVAVAILDKFFINHPRYTTSYTTALLWKSRFMGWFTHITARLTYFFNEWVLTTNHRKIAVLYFRVYRFNFSHRYTPWASLPRSIFSYK